MEHVRALARRSSKESNGLPANNILLRRRSGLCLMDYGAKTALPRYAVERAFPKAFTTNGQKTSWRLVRSGFLAIRRAQQPLMRLKISAVKPVIGLVPLTFRSPNSFMRPFVRMPRGFFHLTTSAAVLDCKTH